jgi:ubiquinone biosynthesis protein
MECIFNDFFTILSFFWIISSESILYLFFRDYTSYIKRLTRKLASVNILYVKLFQAIASNNNLIDEKTNIELLKFTDNAPWCFNDIQIYKLIEIEYKYDLRIQNGYDKPINSGMISLVFKAYRRSDGFPVIIKMKRKNIERKLNNSIENLKTLLYFLSFIPILHKYQIKNLIEKNIEIIKHQTNFNEEVENILKMKTNCKNLKYVKIPEVYPEVTKEFEDFIIMEYINGIKMNEVKEEDYIEFSKQVLKFGLVSTIVHGVTHGDLHSGNILFIKDTNDTRYLYKIGVIDFGIIFELDPEYKTTCFELITNLLKRDPRESIINLLNSNMVEPPNIIQKISPEIYENIVKFGAEIISDYISCTKKVDQIHLFDFLCKLKEYLNTDEMSNLGIRPSDNLVKTQLVLAMAHGVTMTLCKEKFVGLFDTVLNELFHTELLMDD